jgi:endo-1,3-1,4-beta-glycanase ExoK
MSIRFGRSASIFHSWSHATGSVAWCAFVIACGGTPAPGNGTGSAGIGGAASTAGNAGTENAGGPVGDAGGTNGGQGGSGAGNNAGRGGDDAHFTLAWQDDFDTLDTSKWELENFTWEGNQAQFTPDNASVADGLLTLALTQGPAGATKPYLGVEMRSLATIKYGKVSARMRFAAGSGVVSGLVMFYTPYPNCDWNEIDVEHLGHSSSTSQLNAMVYTGAPVPDCTASVQPTQDPQVVSLGFNAEADFHLYDIEWTPAGVSFFTDGVLLRTWTKSADLLKLPQNVLLTIWASNAPSWAGPLVPSSAPTSAQLDWIKVYDWSE